MKISNYALTQKSELFYVFCGYYITLHSLVSTIINPQK